MKREMLGKITFHRGLFEADGAMGRIWFQFRGRRMGGG